MQKLYGVDISPYLKSNSQSSSNAAPFLTKTNDTKTRDERVIPKPRVIEKRYNTASEEDEARSGRAYAKNL